MISFSMIFHNVVDCIRPSLFTSVLVAKVPVKLVTEGELLRTAAAGVTSRIPSKW